MLNAMFKIIFHNFIFRFRTVRICLLPVLHNYTVLVKYYKFLKKPSPRQKCLQVFVIINLLPLVLSFFQAYFVDRCNMTSS